MNLKEITSRVGALHNIADYSALIDLTNQIDIFNSDSFDAAKFRLSALIKLGYLESALVLLNSLLEINSADRWLIFLRLEYLQATNDEIAALDIICEYIDSHENDVDGISFLLKLASKVQRFDIIEKYCSLRFGEKRCDYSSPEFVTTIVVQTYVKVDTLNLLLNDLLECRLDGIYKLLIIKDFPKSNDVLSKSDAVDSLIFDFYPRLCSKFSEVRLVRNNVNLGTSPTCLRGINAACYDKQTEKIIFLEDDCRISPNAFLWFSYAFERLLSDEVLFIGGESIFFNNQSLSHDSSLISDVMNSERLADYEDKYLEVDFVPSTCFALVASNWNKFYKFRGLPEGPESLNYFLKSLGGKCVLPVVPRVNDIGMRHSDGYSMMTLSGKVKEDKNSYLISNLFVEEFSPLNIDSDNFYKATCLLEPHAIDKYFR